jgi:urease accessory protein
MPSPVPWNDLVCRDEQTTLRRLYQEGCAKIRLPRDPDAPGLEAVLLNTSGGLTGGDRMAWQAEVGERARLTLTTQACEKTYRSLEGDAEVDVQLDVGPRGRLDWLPQETILFDRARLFRRFTVEMAQNATLLAVEPMILGRLAMGEDVVRAHLRDRWRVRRGGRLVYADDLRLDGAHAGLPLLAGAKAYASLLFIAPDAERQIDPLRAALGDQGGASAFDGKIVARVLAPDGYALRKALIPAIAVLRGGTPPPRVWRL